MSDDQILVPEQVPRKASFIWRFYRTRQDSRFDTPGLLCDKTFPGERGMVQIPDREPAVGHSTNTTGSNLVNQ